jgi:uncharacterized protein
MTKPRPDLDPKLTGAAGPETNEADTPAADLADAGGPLRQCCVTRERLPIDNLIRFAVSPDGEVTPDISVRLPGRGVWVKAERAALETAVARGAFARALKRQVSVPADLVDRIEAQLVARCIGLIGMARKAGDVVSGFDQVKEALIKARPGILFSASDGAEDGRNRIERLSLSLHATATIARMLTSEELGQAFGRDRVIHGLVKRGQMAGAIKTVYQRLEGLRPPPPAPPEPARGQR